MRLCIQGRNCEGTRINKEQHFRNQPHFCLAFFKCLYSLYRVDLLENLVKTIAQKCKSLLAVDLRRSNTSLHT